MHDEDEKEAEAEGQSEVSAGPGEGCMIRGVVLVNRVPGNFHISAHSKSHSFQPHKLNMSHYVTTMTFGRTLSSSQLRLLPDEVGEGYNGLAFSDHHAGNHNTTLEHYLKVAHTSYEVTCHVSPTTCHVLPITYPKVARTRKTPLTNSRTNLTCNGR